MRPAQILITCLAAIVCASCSALAAARQRIELRRIAEDWGATPTCIEGNPPLTFTRP